MDVSAPIMTLRIAYFKGSGKLLDALDAGEVNVTRSSENLKYCAFIALSIFTIIRKQRSYGSRGTSDQKFFLIAQADFSFIGGRKADFVRLV